MFLYSVCLVPLCFEIAKKYSALKYDGNYFFAWKYVHATIIIITIITNNWFL